jgi:SAM-dependent methyltransferase
MSAQVEAREQAFWDEHVPPLEQVVRRFEKGPDPNTKAMIDAVEPLRGMRVLDFACGAGLTSAFLAQRGALVTAIDISPASIERARQLSQAVNLPVETIAGELSAGTFSPHSFDAVVGRFALHHVDLRKIAPVLHEILVPGGRAGFLETMGLNPLLNLARHRLAGRGRVASYGSEDERPLERSDLHLLSDTIGQLECTVGRMQFLRIFDRNVLHFRHRRVSRALGGADDLLQRLGLSFLSYHQVLELTKSGDAASQPAPTTDA